MENSRKQNAAEKLIHKFKEVKTIPAVALKAVKLIENSSTTLQEIEKVVKLDPVLVLRILKLVNSPYYSLRTKIERVSEAVAFLGIDGLRNLIILDMTKKLFTEKSESQRFSREQLWFHSASVSLCSQMIVERIFGEKGEDAYLSGLVHDIGLIVEEQVMPVEFKALLNSYNPDRDVLVDHENSILRTDHTIVGRLLIKDWGLNEGIQNSIGQHHEYDDNKEPESLAGVLQLSEYLVFRLKFTAFPEIGTVLPKPLLLHMRKYISEYRAIADDLPHELKKAEEIFVLERN